jgi:hypothetical protein
VVSQAGINTSDAQQTLSFLYSEMLAAGTLNELALILQQLLLVPPGDAMKLTRICGGTRFEIPTMFIIMAVHRVRSGDKSPRWCNGRGHSRTAGSKGGIRGDRVYSGSWHRLAASFM